jgi:tetratricopeptide (TPR) repeat protein
VAAVNEESPSPGVAVWPVIEGPPAVYRRLSAELSVARDTRDRVRERALCAELARLLVRRGTDLDQALELARAALALGDEPALRLELAGWLAGMGDPLAAAAALADAGPDVEPRVRARALVRRALLVARDGRAAEAAELLEQAAAADETDPIACEMLGSLLGWAPEIVTRERSTTAYLEAAVRRAARGDADAAREDRLRAFEACPTSQAAARAVARALDEEGRGAAADEVLRDHALALLVAGEDAAACAVHNDRIARALAASEPGRALGAVLDLGVAETDPRRAVGVDEVLARVGLYELLALRILARARRHRERDPRAAAGDYLELAQLASGPLASEERELEARLEAAVLDPTASSYREALDAFAASVGDSDASLEVLVRIVEPLDASGSEASSAQHDLHRARVDAAEALIERALGTSELAPLGVWACERLRRADPARGDDLELQRAELEARSLASEPEIARLRAQVDSRSGGSSTGVARDARVAALRRLVQLLLARPERAVEAFEALATLTRAEPSDEEAFRRFCRVHARIPRGQTSDELYVSVLRRRTHSPPSPRALVRAHELLAELSLARGEQLGMTALDEVAPLCEAPEIDAWAASLVLFHASLRSSAREEARALERCAAYVEREPRAVLLAASAEAYRRAGERAQAARAAEAAVHADGISARAVSAHAAALAGSFGRDVALVLERAIAVVVPRAWLCERLASCLEELREPALSFAWTQRWLALSPIDGRALGELLRRARAEGNHRRIATALAWVLAQPEPIQGRRAAVLGLLERLYELDREQATKLSRKLLDVLGPRDPDVRASLLALSDAWGDAGLSISVLERWFATDPEAGVGALFELAERRRVAGDFGGAARELVRALDRGAEPAEVLGLAERIGGDPVAELERLGSDGAVWLAEAMARAVRAILGESRLEVVEGRAEIDLVEASDLVRRYAALVWDLGGDAVAGEQGFFDAAELLGRVACTRYVSDVFARLPSEQAIAMVVERAEMLPDERASDRIGVYVCAARLASTRGAYEQALETAMSALRMDPSLPEAIEVVERCAPHSAAGIDAVDEVYVQLAESAMGSYGRRAAHYRAARQLEQLGASDRAMAHALEALEAVPNEGQTLALVTRFSVDAGGSSEASQCLERIARRVASGTRSAWLLRAVELAPASERFATLLRAFEACPEAVFASRLADEVPPELDEPLRAQMLERVSKASAAALRGLEGPDGARAGAHLCRALAKLGALDAAYEALDQAVEVDGDVEVYESLLDVVAPLSSNPERAAGFVARVEQRAGDRHALVGPPLLRLGSALALTLHDAAASERLLAEATRREGAEVGGGASANEPHEDPFADFAMFGDGEADPAREPLAAEPAEPPAAELPAAEPAAELPAAELPAAELPAAELPAAELAPLSSPAPSSGSRARDGFDALFTAPTEPSDTTLDASHAEPERAPPIDDPLARRAGGSSWEEQVRELKPRRVLPSDERPELAAAEPAREEPEPDATSALLEALRQGYQARGMGTPREAQHTLEQLSQLRGSVAAVDAELHAFLVAEALDVLQGGGAGMRELSQRHAEFGPRPLIALGMGERLARSRSFEAALPLLEQALDGELRGLRNRGRLLLAVVDAALACGRRDVAARRLEEAKSFLEGPALERRARELAAIEPDLGRARKALEQLVAESTGVARARFSERLAELLHDDEPQAALAHYREAMRLLRRERAAQQRLRASVAALLDSHPELEAPESVLAPPSIPADDDEAPLSDAGPSELEATPTERTPPVEELSADVPPTEGEPVPVVEAPADPPVDVHPQKVDPEAALLPKLRPALESDEEERLYASLLLGDVAAAGELERVLERAGPNRAHDLFVVRRALVALRPGHHDALESLQALAHEQGYESFARALDQVLRLDEGQGALQPPPLGVLRREPELTSSVLLRGLHVPELEVLGLVWEAGMYRRELVSYGLSGSERQQLAPGTAIGDIYADVALHLGTPRAIFQRRERVDGFRVEVALTAPPSIVLVGDAGDDTLALAHWLGAAHLAADPSLTLALSLPTSELGTLFDAVLAAFGPVRQVDDEQPPSSVVRRDLARLGAELWQRITPRAERRFRELSEPGVFDVEVARSAARRAIARAGLFVSGDLGTSLRLAARELGLILSLEQPGALAELCVRSHELCDLVRFATRLEYAELRWEEPPPPSVLR